MEKNKLFDIFADAFAVATTSLLKTNVFGKPEGKEDDIVEWYGKMKLFPWEKFHLPTYLGILHFYASDADRDSDNPTGSIIVYFDKKESKELLLPLTESKSIKTPEIEAIEDYEEKEKALTLKSVEKFISKIGSSALSGVQSAGFSCSLMSDPLTSTAEDFKETISFNPNSQKVYEIRSIIEKGQTICLDYIFPEE